MTLGRVEGRSTIQHLIDRRTAVYRYYAGDALLYVGITVDTKRRHREHRREAPAWFAQHTHRTVIWYETGPEAVAAELLAVRAEKPLYNVRRSPQMGTELRHGLAP